MDKDLLKNLKRFPVIDDLRTRNDIEILERIYPLKQQDVANIRDYAKTNGRIQKIMVFGSATR